MDTDERGFKRSAALWCPQCEIAYTVESAKRLLEQPPSLF
jgi:hypothetical protein